MPTATTTTRKAAKPRTKAARKPAASKAAATRTQTAARQPAGGVGDYAERAVLIPVGAALIAREKVVSTVSDTLSTYSSSAKTQAQLKRFERRGATARKRLEREVRKARVRVERELRQRRRDIESTVNERVSVLDSRREAIAKNAKDVQERILSLV